METRNVSITLEKAKEWYNSNNKSLKEVALQAFKEDELKELPWEKIKTFKDALDYLILHNFCSDLIGQYAYAFNNAYIKKILEYQIVVAALTNNEERHLTTGERWFPVIQFCKPGKEKICWGNKIVGTIKSEGQKFTVVGGNAINATGAGLGRFDSYNSVSSSWPAIGFRSVSRREIAEHISKYFGRLLFEVHYGGVNCNWEWID